MATLISTLYTTKRKASYLTFQKENKDIRREREREREREKFPLAGMVIC
jgi:hypothetical protein